MRRALRLIALLVVFSVVLGVSSSLDARAQSSTTLKLIDQVSEPGGATVPGDTLSSGARAAVLSRETEVVQAYALSNLEFDRDGIKKRIREGSAKTFRLIRGGRTPRQFERTEAPGKVYYVLALTAGGELLESYVNAGNRSYLPGFAIVASGNMPMGQVPEEHREPLRGALTSAMSPEVADTADGSQAEEDAAGTSSPEEEQKRAEPEGAISREDSGGGYFQVFLGASYSEVIMFLLGLIFGGIGAWMVYIKYSNKLSKKKIKINKLEKKIHRKISKKKSGAKNSVHEEVLNKEKKKMKELKKKMKRKEQKIGRLERKLNQSEGTSSRKTSDQKYEPSASQAYESNSYDEGAPWAKDVDSEVATVGRVFADWCRTTGDQNERRMEEFAEQLEAEVPGAEVHRIYREKYAEELVFTDSAREPVEYWLVRLGQRSLLLPKLQQSGFRELEECFEAKNISSDDADPVFSAIAPEDVKHLLPATLVEEGGRGRTLGEKGYISPETTGGSESSGHTEESGDGTTASVSRTKPTARTIGEVFVEWCHSEDTMIGRYYMFERTLNETLSDAEVSPIYRQSDADGRYSFDADNTSGEFWLVEAEGERWLLPAPQKRDRFVAIGKAFSDTEASPSALSKVAPAQMAPDGAHFELQHPGRLKAAVAP